MVRIKNLYVITANEVLTKNERLLVQHIVTNLALALAPQMLTSDQNKRTREREREGVQLPK